MPRSIVLLLGLATVDAGCGRLGFTAAPDPAGDGGGAGGDGGSASRDAAGASAFTVAAYQLDLDAATQVIPIAAVDPARTLVLCDFLMGDANNSKLPRCELVDATTVLVSARLADPTIRIHVQVIEFSPGARVQRGALSMPSTRTAELVTIDAVDPGRAFAVRMRTGALDSEGLDDRFGVTARLADATTLALERSTMGNTVDLSWQVVELPDARVQAGRTTLTDGATAATGTVAPVEASRTFVISTSRGGAGNEGDDLARARLADPVTIAVARTTSTAVVDVEWFAVELPRVLVQAGEISTGGATMLAPGLAPVEPTRSFALLSLSGGDGVSTNLLDEVMCTSTVEVDRLLIERGDGSDVGGVVAWSVVESLE